MVPTVELPPAIPLTLHATVDTACPFSTAPNFCFPEIVTWAVAGDTVRAATVTSADPDLVGSVLLVAAIVTAAGAGGVLGAVYRPAVLTVPRVELPPAIPLTDHATAELNVPVP
jgi:hypothetical protein